MLKVASGEPSSWQSYTLCVCDQTLYKSIANNTIVKIMCYMQTEPLSDLRRTLSTAFCRVSGHS